jgi:SEC-C motif domain protein
MIAAACPCGGTAYVECCGRYLDDKEVAPTAEALMRSRYTAYTLRREDYVLATWHISTRPASLSLADDSETKWLGLDVKRHVVDATDTNRAIVEFVARFKVGGGRAERLHEVSRFLRAGGQWFYLDGEIKEAT